MQLYIIQYISHHLSLSVKIPHQCFFSLSWELARLSNKIAFSSFYNCSVLRVNHKQPYTEVCYASTHTHTHDSKVGYNDPNIILVVLQAMDPHTNNPQTQKVNQCVIKMWWGLNPLLAYFCFTRAGYFRIFEARNFEFSTWDKTALFSKNVVVSYAEEWVYK